MQIRFRRNDLQLSKLCISIHFIVNNTTISAENQLIPTDTASFEENGSGKSNLYMTQRQVLRYMSVTLKYAGHENAGYVKFSVFA